VINFNKKSAYYLDLFSNKMFTISESDNRGIYFLHSNEEIVYVGQSIHLYDRPFNHKDKTFDKVTGFEAPLDWLDYLESAFVGLLRPRYNGFANRKKATHNDYRVADNFAFGSPKLAIALFKIFEQKNFLTETLFPLKPKDAHHHIYLIEREKVAHILDGKNILEEAACP